MPLSAFVQRQSTVRVPKEETQQTNNYWRKLQPDSSLLAPCFTGCHSVKASVRPWLIFILLRAGLTRLYFWLKFMLYKSPSSRYTLGMFGSDPGKTAYARRLILIVRNRINLPGAGWFSKIAAKQTLCLLWCLSRLVFFFAKQYKTRATSQETKCTSNLVICSYSSCW